MTIRQKNPYGPIDPVSLERFEAELPGPLPASFRSFLLEANGAEFTEHTEFDEVPGGTALAELFVSGA